MSIAQPEIATRFAALNPPKRYLFGPGPTMVHPRVYEALSKPIVGHLDPYFIRVMEDVQQLLKPVFGTSEGVTMAISATGSGGMEAAVSNFVEPGSKFAVFANGYFCDRISEMAVRQGANVVRREKPWGKPLRTAKRPTSSARKTTGCRVRSRRDFDGRTPAGQAICKAAREVKALVIADCVTSLGGVPVEADKTGIDVAYSCTQKGLSCPPGLSPIFISKRGMDWLGSRRSPPHSWYFDIKLIHDYASVSHRYHHTAPISMFYALREALTVIAEEGAENRWQRHRHCHEMFVRGIESMGLRMHVPEGQRIWTLNTVSVPVGIDDARFVSDSWTSRASKS